MTARERPDLFAALCAAMAMAIAAVIAAQLHLRVSPWTLAAMAIPWLAIGITLQVKRGTYGREGRVVDLWSIPHLLGGALLGAVGVGLPWVVAIAVVWELVEITARVPEYPTNRVADVVLAVVGWAAIAAFA